MLVTVYYREGAPDGILVETHELVQHSLPQRTFDEDWGSTTYDICDCGLCTAERLLMDGRGLVLYRSVTARKSAAAEDDFTMPGQKKPVKLPYGEHQAEPEQCVIVPSGKMQYVKRVDADGETVWTPDAIGAGGVIDQLEGSLAGKLDSLLGSL